MSSVDLHIHSSASDGRYSPAEIVRQAAELGLRVIALTDHDTVAGLPEAVAAAEKIAGFRLIPGVEISTDVTKGEIHILGYFIDYTSPELLARLAEMRDSRVTRAKRMVAKLEGLGVSIEWSRVQELAAGASSIGRPHIAQAMLEKGYIDTFKEAFDRYIGHEGPAYVERDKMTPIEAVRLIIGVGGLPVFAHPITYSDYAAITPELVAAGMVGMEAHYKDATPEEVKSVVALTEKYSLIPTGGSDYHGINADEVMMGGVDVPLAAAERLFALARERSLRGAG